MADLCPTCGQAWPAEVDDVDQLVAQLQDWCERHNYWISADGRVREQTAAELLDRSCGTLRNWRNGCGELRFYRHRGRVTYALKDLATYLEAGRVDDEF